MDECGVYLDDTLVSSRPWIDSENLWYKYSIKYWLVTVSWHHTDIVDWWGGSESSSRVKEFNKLNTKQQNMGNGGNDNWRDPIFG